LAGQAWLGWTRTGGLARLDKGGEYWGSEMKRGVVVLNKNTRHCMKKKEKKDRIVGGQAPLYTSVPLSNFNTTFPTTHFPFLYTV
jgi:hypothetical protein